MDAYSPSHHHNDALHTPSYDSEVSSLRKEKRRLEQKVAKLEIKLASMAGSLKSTNELYEKLLNSINSLSAGGSSLSVQNPFLALLESVRNADTFPLYNRDDLPHIKYWTKAEYLRDYQNGRGYVTTIRNDDSGAVGFLEDEDGIIVSKNEQQKCRDYQRSLCYTLLKYGLAPCSWSKMSTEALEFFVRSMRITFPIFRYCANNWKADSFMGLYYSQWSDRPRAPPQSIQVKQESRESSAESSSSSSASNPKRQQTQIIHSSIRVKKKKIEHAPRAHSQLTMHEPSELLQAPTPTGTVSSLNDAERVSDTDTTPQLSDDNTPQLQVDKSNHDVQELNESNAPGLNKRNAHELNQGNAPEASTCNNAGPLRRDLKIVPAIPTESNMSETNKGTFDFDPLQLLASMCGAASNVIPSQAKDTIPPDVPIASNASVEIIGNNGDAPDTSKRKRNAPDRNSVMRPSSSSTARNLCAIEWVKEHKGGKMGEFADYWDDLVKRKDPLVETFNERARMVKVMRKQVCDQV